MERQPPVVRVAAHGPSRAAARLWRFRGQLRVTVIAKATFTLVHQAMMKIAAPEAIVTGDVHHKNNPARSVRLTSDLAPYLARADVLLTGHACARRGAPTASMMVSLALHDRYDVVFEKHLEVRGEVGPEGPAPFETMPLVYEKAYGGPGWQDNPLGVGTGGTREQPSIRYIGEPQRTAGFGPLPGPWPTRKKLVSTETRKAVERPVAEIPEGFDWTYFQAAPPDQQCDFLNGTEWVVIEGTSPDEPRMRSRLPTITAAARVSWDGAPEGDGEEIELVADTLRVDADQGTCSVTWRKSFAVADESRLDELRVAAGVAFAGLPVPWSEPPRAGGPADAPVPAPREIEASSTMTLDDDEIEIVRAELDAYTAAPVSSRRRPAARAAPKILGAFRLEVLSPAYASNPDDPLLSTLVIHDMPAAPAPAGGGTLRMADAPQGAPQLGPQGTLVMDDGPASPRQRR